MPSKNVEGDALRAVVNHHLNVLSPDKFAELWKGMVALVKKEATTGSMLRIVVTVFFDRALAEPHYASLYAQLCEVLSRHLPTVPDIT